MGLTTADYGRHLLELLPWGRAWAKRRGSQLEAVAEGFGEELARADARAQTLRDEVDPFLSLELLPEWERVLGLPDPCVARALSVEERRASVVARLGSLGGQSRAFYAALAAALGFPGIEIIEYTTTTCTSTCIDPITRGPWIHTWAVRTTLDRVTVATCRSTCVEALRVWGNDALECALERAKPAHTILLFFYIPDPQPENLIFVYIDDAFFWEFFADVVQFAEGSGEAYENRFPQAPVFSALVASGVRATNAKATAVCSPGRATLHTGVFNFRHGLGTVIRPDADGELREFGDPGYSWALLADKLARVPVHSGVFGKLHLFQDPETEDGLGHDGIAQRLGAWSHWELTRANLNQPPFPPGTTGGYYAFQKHVKGAGTRDVLGDYATSHFLERARQWILSLPPGEPFLCWLPMHAVHSPFDAAPEEAVYTEFFRSEPASAFKRQLGMMEALDYYFGQFLEGLPPSIREKTSILFLGDNGPDGVILESGREDEGKEWGPTWDALIDDPEKKVKQSVFFFGLWAQLVYSGPDVKTPGRTTRVPMQVADVHQLILDYFGVPQDHDVEPIDGVPILAHLRDEEEPIPRLRNTQFSEFYRPNGDPTTIEPAALTWNSSTDYSVGTEVNHLGTVYEALVASGPGNGGAVEPGSAGSSTEWASLRFRDYRLECDVTGQTGGPDFNGRFALIQRLGMADRLIQLWREDGTPVDPFELGAAIDLVFGDPRYQDLHDLLEGYLEEILENPPGPRDAIRVRRADGIAGSVHHDGEGRFPVRRADGVLGWWPGTLAAGDLHGTLDMEAVGPDGLHTDGGKLLLQGRILSPNALGIRRADGQLGKLPLGEDGTFAYRNAASVLGSLTVEGVGGGVVYTNEAGTEGTLLLI